MDLKGNKVIYNASWIIGSKLLKAIISFIIGVFTVRYLGPSNYGIINYVSAIVAFVMPIMQLGFPSILVNEIVNHPDEEGKILGTSLVLSIIASIFSVISVIMFAMTANAGKTETIVVCSLYSLILIFQASEMTRYWFQAKLLSKYSEISSLIAYGLVSIYKVYLLVSNKSLVWFAMTHVIEAIIISVLLLFLYSKFSNQKLSFSLSLGKAMFSKSKYYIISGLMLIIFTQTDKIMLNFLMGDIATGYYSCALTCVNTSGFVFAAIIDSARPSVFEARRYSEELFEKRLSMLFSLVIWLSLVQSIFMTVFANLIISILYGQSYMPAVGVLQIAVWYVTFSNIGSVESIWVVSESKQNYLPWINLFGAILNILVNFSLIPVWGAIGAAFASVVTQLFSKFFLFFIIKPMRPIGKIMLKSFNPIMLIEFLKGKVQN